MDTLHHRFFTLEPAAEGEAIPVVLSTEAPVMRGGFREVLKHTPAAVDLSRFPLPLLISHDQTQLPVGVIESPQVVNGKLRAIAKFGSSDQAKQILTDVKNRIIRSLSVGYRILEDRIDGDTVTALQWMPYEASLVAAPADPGAGFFRTLETHTMPAPHTPTPVIDHQEPQLDHPDVSLNTRSERALLAAERRRAAAIRDLVKRHHGSDDMAQRFIDEGAPLQVVADTMLERTIARQTADRIDGHLPMSALSGGENFGGLGPTHMRAAAVDALLQRAGIPVENPHPQAAALRGVGLVDLARSFLSEAGDRILAGNPAQLLQRAMTTSDFPNVLEQVTDKAVLSAFYNAPPSHFGWSVQRDAQYFRPQHFASLSDAPALAEVVEGAEYTHGPLFDKKETVSLLKYGKIVHLTWEALARDDLGVFADVVQQMAVAARATLADHAYAVLAANPAMSDGVPLFHAMHENLAGSGGAIAVNTLDAARLALRNTKGANGHYRDINPAILLIPESLRTAAESMLAPFNPAKTADIRPRWLQSLNVISDPRLTGSAWYLLGDLAQPAFVRLAMGTNPIETFREDGFEVDGVKYKVRCVFGFGAVDYQAAYMNPGAGA